MDKPFDFNQIADIDGFCGRKDELKKLSSNFILLTNTAVIAPQGWGKSSLLHKAAEVASRKDNDLRFCHVKLSNVRSEERFYELLVQGVLRAVSKSQEDIISNVKKYFRYTHPRVSFGGTSALNFNIDMDWEEIRRHKDRILDLPYTVSRDMNIKLVICVDDFQNVSLFSDPESFMDLMKDRWTGFDKVAFCMSGTSTPLTDRFFKTSKIFSRYGEVMNLTEVDATELVLMIRDRFADSGKYIDKDNAGMIISLSEGNLFYAMQLAHLSWLGTGVVCSSDVVLQARETVIDQMRLVFENITASLTTQQLCYLHAVLAGETVISTAEVLHRHHISSATSASRSKAALLERGVVCSIGGKICLADPMYAFWLKNRYFVEK